MMVEMMMMVMEMMSSSMTVTMASISSRREFPGSQPGELFSLGVLRPQAAVTLREKKMDVVDIVSWREYEALRNEMRRKFREQGERLNEDIQKVTKNLDATNETVNTIQEQMTDVQRNLQALALAIDNLTQKQQQSHHEDEESNHDNFDEEPAAEERGVGCGVGRGARGRGFVPVGAA
ncbi:hypothetical protein QYE76_035424 [Lolium multiflorum]|uniref:Uncharacterized protein n=1 Tax=Lolium multiflorum TaxID=4521 RepID=A0AAD8VNG1_LOLMU|nr:hypothetical protein QYE76_035424 [Lolium multiflorum]